MKKIWGSMTKKSEDQIVDYPGWIQSIQKPDPWDRANIGEGNLLIASWAQTFFTLAAA